MEKIQLQKITAEEAVPVLQAAGVGRVDGFHTPAGVAGEGVPFKLSTSDGVAVGVLEKRGSELWVRGFGGVGCKGVTPVAMEIAEGMARHADCQTVGFQTFRPGLVKLAKKNGYRVTGYIMEKSV